MHMMEWLRGAWLPGVGPGVLGRHALMALGLGAVLSLVLYAHGASWWYAPGVAVMVVGAHLAVLGGGFLVATRAGRNRGTAAGLETRAESSHPRQARPGVLIRSPRFYDWLVWTVTLGRERAMREWMLDLAELKEGAAVLDVGCGTGTLLLAAARRTGPRGVLLGVEAAEEMTARAREKARSFGVELAICEGSADALPYPDASVDTVLCSMVLHHLPGIQSAALREMRRVLRPGGLIVIVDLQRPRSLASAVALVSLLHRVGPGHSPPDVRDVEPLLSDLGFDRITRHSFGVGAIGAMVGRLSSDSRLHESEAGRS